MKVRTDEIVLALMLDLIEEMVDREDYAEQPAIIQVVKELPEVSVTRAFAWLRRA